MKTFFKPNKFKIIFSLVYIVVFYCLHFIPNFAAEYQEGLFYSLPNFVFWVLAWPMMFLVRLSDWYQRQYQGCIWLCLPDTKTEIVIFIVGIIYVYVLSCIISPSKQKNN